MVSNIKYFFAKNFAIVSSKVLNFLPTGGKSLPGLIFLKLGGIESLSDLSKKQTNIGSILITGTNGKTTSTTMIIKLLSQDYNLSYSVENNTIYSLSTSLLLKKSEIGVFEYGIRDIEHGTPEILCDLIKPVGVVYTNISREHTQIAGVKNPFENYVKAKTLLSKSLEDSVIITNADDPNTTFIGKNKEKNNTVIYYGMEIDSFNDIFAENIVQCPNCKKELKYDVHYFNQRGVYHCDCGFKRPELNVKVTKYTQNIGSCTIEIDVNVYNYIRQDYVDFKLELDLAIIGIHNIYNILTAITTYSVFTSSNNIKENIEDFYKDYEFIIPPGRFEILQVNNKIIGVGQGDNGDALKVNSLLMNEYTGNDFEFIYTTPDLNEEEIFEDHKSSIKTLNPSKLVVMPGRVSKEAAEEYYDRIKDDFKSSYISVDFNFKQRIEKIIELINNSEYDIIMISGCGEEISFWNELKKEIKSMNK